MNAVTTYLEETLTILVHSHLLQSASLKCPLESIVAGSASEVAVTKKHGGGDQKELEKIQGYVEDRQEKKKIDPYQSSNLSRSDYANHSSLVEMDGLSEQRSSLSVGRPRFSPLICSTPYQKIFIHDLTSRNAASLTRIADSSINSAKSGVQTGHLLYGNEDPRTISLQSSTDFIRNLKSRRRALDGS